MTGLACTTCGYQGREAPVCDRADCPWPRSSATFLPMKETPPNPAFRRVLQTMELYRIERIRWFRENPDKIGNDKELPPELSRETEAAAILRAVALANPASGEG